MQRPNNIASLFSTYLLIRKFVIKGPWYWERATIQQFTQLFAKHYEIRWFTVVKLIVYYGCVLGISRGWALLSNITKDRTGSGVFLKKCKMSKKISAVVQLKHWISPSVCVPNVIFHDLVTLFITVTMETDQVIFWKSP